MCCGNWITCCVIVFTCCVIVFNVELVLSLDLIALYFVSVMLNLAALFINERAGVFRKDEVIEIEEVSVYDIKDHGYAKFRLGHVFVRMESAQVCDVALTYTPQPIKKGEGKWICSAFTVAPHIQGA